MLNWRAKIKLNKGFTIIEVLIALSVVFITVITSAQLFLLSTQVQKNSEKVSVATALAQGKLEESIIAGYDALPVGTLENHQRVSSSPQSDFYTYWRTTAVEYLDSNFSVTGSDQGLKKISVTIFWQRQGFGSGEKNLTMTSVLSKQ
jgi:type II secretory pathway pseudopilin PulG